MQTERRPIIFIAHSLGGILVKAALIHSEGTRRGHLEDHKAIKLSTYGVLFFGTPHLGTRGIQAGKILANIGSVVAHTNTKVMRNLEEDSEWLQMQLGQYRSISNDFVTKFYYETLRTPLPLGGSKMVLVQLP